jgi:hypothetical protein
VRAGRRPRAAPFGSGRELFNQDVARNRTNYQFTREHAGRSIVEYNTLSRRLSVSLLYTYLPKPNTAIYAGYGDLLINEDRSRLENRPGGLQRPTRTLFLKLSHSFQR